MIGSTKLDRQFVFGVVCLVAIIGSASIGCQGRPSRVSAPSWDPDQISSRALEQLDANGDAVIDKEEAQKAPGLAAAIERIDTDDDGRMSAEEIKRRIELYEKVGIGLTSQTFRVVLNGRPLTNARVEFVPEDFLDGTIKAATDYTDGEGIVVPQTDGQSIPAMQIGFYRVMVYLLPNEKPLKLDQLVGVEVPPVSAADESGTPVLSFKSS